MTLGNCNSKIPSHSSGNAELTTKFQSRDVTGSGTKCLQKAEFGAKLFN